MTIVSENNTLDETIILKDNAMLKVRPDLFNEWDFEKNDKSGLDVYKVTKGMGKNVWWICSKCKSEFSSTINNRTQGKGCPYCAGRKVNYTNSLQTLNPKLASEWHPILNGELTPNNVTTGNNIKKIWWLGKCGHEWEATIPNRNNHNQGCSICNGKRVLVGFNDMWTTNPELAKSLLNPEDGHIYTQNSNVNVDWKCLDCGEIIRKRRIGSIKRQGISCPVCSDGFSYPERFIYHTLSYSDIEFEFEKVFDWSDGRRYDFYLPDNNAIIEVHGRQHYEEAYNFGKLGGRSLEEEIENDEYKQTNAIKNNIDNYIVINGSKSCPVFMKESIINSELVGIIGMVDFDLISEKAEKSRVIDVWELWNTGQYDAVSDIAKDLKLSNSTARKYLKLGYELGKCNYTVELSIKNGIRKHNKNVVQLDLNGNFIKEWESLKSASLYIEKRTSNMTWACQGENRTSGGFKWMYKEDYVNSKEYKEDVLSFK